VIDADAMVLGLGSIPAAQWLTGSEVPADDGVLCDQYCAAPPGIHAVGDITDRLDVRTGRRRRDEHRTNTSEQAVAVARNILAAHDKRTACTPTPYLWSDQFGCRIQCYGWADEGQDVQAVEGEPEQRKFVALHHDHGRVTAVVGMNSARAMRSHPAALSTTADPVGPSSSWAGQPGLHPRSNRGLRSTRHRPAYRQFRSMRTARDSRSTRSPTSRQGDPIMFIAHYIAGWLGVPAGIVIAALFILRKRGKALHARRKQARVANTSQSTLPGHTEQ
jgi:hypothetical protein